MSETFEASSNPCLITAAMRIALEQAAARLVSLDPVVGQRLQALDGQVLQLQSTLPAFNLFIRFSGQPDVLAVYEPQPDCVVTGTALDLLRVALDDQPLLLLPRTDVVLTGNNQLLQSVSDIMREADIDWEGFIAQHTGGVIAHLLGQAARRGQRIVAGGTRRAMTNLPEVIQEELRVLPPSGEVDAFRDDLDQLRLAADRLQARVERLVKTV